MRKSKKKLLLVISTIICFGVALGVSFFNILPQLQAVEPLAIKNVHWQNLGLPLVFSLFWSGCGILSAFLLVKERSATTGHIQSDEKPWLSRREWASPVVQSDILFQLFVVWAIALVSISITIGFYFLARKIISEGDFGSLMILAPFALAGLGMITPAVNLMRNLFRFGSTPLIMDPYPGSIGGHLGGRVDVRLPYNPKNHIQVNLFCLRHWKPRHNRHMKSETVWQIAGLARTERSSKGTRLVFGFDVPENLHSSEPPSFNYHEWRVKIRARIPGTDLNRGFDVPVFPTAGQVAGTFFDSTKHPDYPRYRQIEALSILKIDQDSDGGVILRCATYHRKKVRGGLILLAVGLGCGLPGIAMLMDNTIGLGLIFSILGGLFFIAGFYGLFHSISAKLGTAGLEATLRILGIPIRRRKAAKADIKYLGLYRGNWVAAFTNLGKPITLSQSFGDEKVAAKALKVICNRTGYSARHKAKNKKRD